MNILTRYHAYVESFPLSAARVGMFKPGRYSGFNAIKSGSGGVGIPIKLYHSLNSIRPTGNDNVLQAYEGTVMTNHGTVLKTTEEIALNIATNPSGNLDLPQTDRWDLIYLEYTWTPDDVITEPFIAVKTGSLGLGKPQLDNVAIQVKLGYVRAALGADTIEDLTYYPERIPWMGDNITEDFSTLFDAYYAKINSHNYFSGAQSVVPLSQTITPTEGNPATSYTLTLGDSNVFMVNCNYQSISIVDLAQNLTTHPYGSRISIYFYNCGTLVQLRKSSTGKHPGFLWSGQGVYANLLYWEVRNGDTFEFIHESNGTWRIVGYSDTLAYLQARNQIDIGTIKSWMIAPTAWRIVPAYSSTELDKFLYHRDSLYPGDDVSLRYRTNAFRQLQITGHFRLTNDDPDPGAWCKIFTVLSSYRPNRKVYFQAYLESSSNIQVSQVGGAQPAYLDRNGALWVKALQSNTTDFSINVTIDYMPTDGTIASE